MQQLFRTTEAVSVINTLPLVCAMSSIQRLVSPELPTTLANHTHVDLPGYDIWLFYVCLRSNDCPDAHARFSSTVFLSFRQSLIYPSLKRLSPEFCNYTHTLQGSFDVLTGVGL